MYYGGRPSNSFYMMRKKEVYVMTFILTQKVCIVEIRILIWMSGVEKKEKKYHCS